MVHCTAAVCADARLVRLTMGDGGGGGWRRIMRERGGREREGVGGERGGGAVCVLRRVDHDYLVSERERGGWGWGGGESCVLRPVNHNDYLVCVCV